MSAPKLAPCVASGCLLSVCRALRRTLSCGVCSGLRTVQSYGVSSCHDMLLTRGLLQCDGTRRLGCTTQARNSLGVLSFGSMSDAVPIYFYFTKLDPALSCHPCFSATIATPSLLLVLLQGLIGQEQGLQQLLWSFHWSLQLLLRHLLSHRILLPPAPPAPPAAAAARSATTPAPASTGAAAAAVLMSLNWGAAPHRPRMRSKCLQHPAAGWPQTGPRRTGRACGSCSSSSRRSWRSSSMTWRQRPL